MTTVVDGYIAMWNETDPERRRVIIAQTWTDDGTYLDPHVEVAGAAASRDGRRRPGAVPGHRFVLAAGPDAHHDRVRFTWHLVADERRAVATGRDVAVVADDGRLRDVTGFLEAA